MLWTAKPGFWWWFFSQEWNYISLWGVTAKLNQTTKHFVMGCITTCSGPYNKPSINSNVRVSLRIVTPQYWKQQALKNAEWSVENDQHMLQWPGMRWSEKPEGLSGGYYFPSLQGRDWRNSPSASLWYFLCIFSVWRTLQKVKRPCQLKYRINRRFSWASHGRKETSLGTYSLYIAVRIISICGLI